MLNSFVTSVGQTKTNQVPYELRIRTPASPNCQSGALPTAYKKLLASKVIYQVYIIAYTIWDWIGCTDRWSLLLASCSNKKNNKNKKKLNCIQIAIRVYMIAVTLCTTFPKFFQPATLKVTSDVS